MTIYRYNILLQEFQKNIIFLGKMHVLFIKGFSFFLHISKRLQHKIKITNKAKKEARSRDSV